LFNFFFFLAGYCSLFLLGEASLLETAGRFFIASAPKSKKKKFRTLKISQKTKGNSAFALFPCPIFRPTFVVSCSTSNQLLSIESVGDRERAKKAAEKASKSKKR